MRKFLWLLLLIAVLAGLLLVRGFAQGWHYVLAAESGTVLYSAGFDALADEWTEIAGRQEALIEAGTLRLRSELTNAGFYSAAFPHFADFDLQVQARAVGGPLNNGYGIIFRLQDKGNTAFTDDSYYLFLISSDGYYQVRRVLDGVERVLSTWIPSPVIRQGVNGEVNWLRVVAQGGEFRFYANQQPLELCIPDSPDGLSTFDDISGTCLGQMTEVLVDDTIPYGQIGLSAQTLDEPGVIVEFDHLVITAP